MRNRTFVKGDSPEKKFDSIEKVLNRFSRRLHKAVVFASPPTIIHSYHNTLPEDKVVLRCVIPCNGIIKKIMTVLSFDGNKNEVTSKVSVGNIEYTNPDKDIEVRAGDKIVISLETLGADIYTSLLFIADYSASSKESFSIDALELISNEE